MLLTAGARYSYPYTNNLIVGNAGNERDLPHVHPHQ